mmetsp:Transcript_39479/g.92342  ORF Transcript_39479/g.92342 Transcript_39479/m.92342 type:complete len:221 (-) Transcript_39479:98-760(-)
MFAKSLLPESRLTVSRRSASDPNVEPHLEPELWRRGSSSSVSKVEPMLSSKSTHRVPLPASQRILQSSASWKGPIGSEGRRDTPLHLGTNRSPLLTIRSATRKSANRNELDEEPDEEPTRPQLDSLGSLLPPALGSSMRRRRSSFAEVAAMASPAVHPVEPLQWRGDSLRLSQKRSSQVLGGIGDSAVSGELADTSRDVTEEVELEEVAFSEKMEQSAVC